MGGRGEALQLTTVQCSLTPKSSETTRQTRFKAATLWVFPAARGSNSRLGGYLGWQRKRSLGNSSLESEPEPLHQRHQGGRSPRPSLRQAAEEGALDPLPTSGLRSSMEKPKRGPPSALSSRPTHTLAPKSSFRTRERQTPGLSNDQNRRPRQPSSHPGQRPGSRAAQLPGPGLRDRRHLPRTGHPGPVTFSYPPSTLSANRDSALRSSAP